MRHPPTSKLAESVMAHSVERLVMRRVVKSEWVGACRYTGYIAKSVRLILDCGHEIVRKASQGIPRKSKCRECSLPHNTEVSSGAKNL